MKLPQNVIDMTGMKFGKCTVIEYAGQNKKHCAMWKCSCECGRTKNIEGYKLRSGHTSSCGCLRSEWLKDHVTEWNTIHGLAYHPLYRVWSNIKQRCYNQKNKWYFRYGGRGIAMCEEWMDFMVFYEWAIANGYKSGLSLDRIDNDKGYSPENCRWVTAKIQCNNKGNNKKITIGGKTKTMKEWAELYGAKYNRVQKRIESGWPTEKALLESRKSPKEISIGGISKSFAEWSKVSGISPSIIRDRYRSGWSAEEAVFTPPKGRRKL